MDNGNGILTARTRVVGVRLTEDEYRRLVEHATRNNVPPTTLAYTLLMERMEALDT